MATDNYYPYGYVANYGTNNMQYYPQTYTQEYTPTPLPFIGPPGNQGMGEIQSLRDEIAALRGELATLASKLDLYDTQSPPVLSCNECEEICGSDPEGCECDADSSEGNGGNSHHSTQSWKSAEAIDAINERRFLNQLVDTGVEIHHNHLSITL